MSVAIAPSILSANFARLGEQVAEVEKSGADRIHIDVVDGHFVPNLSMGAPIVASLRPVTRLPLETHLMVSNPDFFLQEFAGAGSDSFLVHWEGNLNLHRTVQSIRAIGKRAGVANPATPADVLEERFGHQHFLHSTLGKINRVRRLIDRVKPECDLEVDGGIDPETARLCVEAGANVLVAGSAVFGSSESVMEAMSRLRAQKE